jgi:hypothetical protein
VDEGFQAVLDQLWWAVETIGHVVSDPLLAGGMVAGAGALAWGGWLAARRYWLRPVPAVLAGISLGLVLGVTFSRTLPDWVLAPGREFCHLNGFSLHGSAELLNALLFVPFVLCAVLATHRPLAVAASAVALSALIEVVQPLTGRGLCETQDFFNNSAGAVMAAGLAAGLLAVRERVAR